MQTTKTKKAPLFTVFRRENQNNKMNMLIRVCAVLIAFLVMMGVTMIIVRNKPAVAGNPFKVFGFLFEGAFNMPWALLYDACLLLGFGLAIVPAFKMKFWNMGANGQVLIGALASCLVMFYGAKKINSNFVLIVLMLLCALLASILWAVIPAIFKAFFNTNETLFTLMMNYISISLVAYFNFVMAGGTKETPGIINFTSRKGWIYFKNLPANMRAYLLMIILVIIVAVFIYIYINKTKHGYEVTVLGDSVRTAKYVGMDTKWITIRTLFISGVITGLIGFLLCSCVNHSVSQDLCGSKGFTGILIAWLANFNPLIMGGISLFLAFIERGTSKITSRCSLGSNDLSSVIIGVIFFAILISEFFIRYRVKINKNDSKLGAFLGKIFKSKSKDAQEIEALTAQYKKEKEEAQNQANDNQNIDNQNIDNQNVDNQNVDNQNIDNQETKTEEVAK